jgi:5-methylthioadenosine/S-adenosylhomocysteine deaminase
MPSIKNCVVLHGPELTPHRCRQFSWLADTIETIELGEPCQHLVDETVVIIPGLYNGHTHVGDGAMPDGATGLTLEEGFFRPHGYKYRELAKLNPDQFQQHLQATLHSMARTGTVAHFDFREQGVGGAEQLRRASNAVGVASIILSQFDHSPFDAAALATNTAALPSETRAELLAMLEVADGFSESTMNDLTDPAWREIAAITGERGKLCAIHCLENAGYRTLSKARTGHGDLQQAIALLAPHLVVHLTAADAAEIALMRESGRTAAVNPRANATLGLTLPPVLSLLDAGVPLLLGTDNVMLVPPNLFAELDFTFRLVRSQAGEDRPAQPAPLDLLKMVTTHPARLLGGDHHGYIAEGLPASFVALDFSAAHLRSTHHLPATLIGRVGSADVLATYREGRSLWQAPGFAP